MDDIFGAAMAEVAENKPEATPAEAGVPVDVSTGSGVPTTDPLTRLAAFVTDAFVTNAAHRRSSGVDDRLRHAIRMQTCHYTDEQLMKLKRAGIDSRVFVPVTATKVRAAKAMLSDIFNSSGEWPFTLSPTPDPDLAKSVRDQIDAESRQRIASVFASFQANGTQELPPQVMQQMQGLIVAWVNGRYDEIANLRDTFAKSRAKRMERKVQDILTEGGWHKAFYEYVDYVCTYGTGVLVGPVPKTVPVNKCREDRKTGAVKYERTYRTILTYEAVNPNDCYPAPDARYVEDGPLCIRVKYLPNELASFVASQGGRGNSKRGDGWMVGTLRALIRRWPKGGCRLSLEPRDQEVREAERKGTENPKDCTMEGIRCFASVLGADLIQFGITETPEGRKISQDSYYATETVVIDGYVVYCRIIDDRLGRPVSKGVFYELPGSWWGESVADKLAMVQITMNNVAKALLQNMSVASGPMYWVADVSRMADKSPEALKPRPHKIYAFNASYGMSGAGAPMGTISVPSNASELLAVWDKMRIQADDDSGIPAYTYGQSGGQGALRTASGLAIFTEAASRGMKMVVETTDRLVTRDQVKKTCNWILLNDDDLDLKGDCEVSPAGVMGKILKAQQDQQRLQFLNMAISNPMLQQIFGVRGIVSLLRPSIQDLAINPDDCLPSDERLKEMEIVAKIQQVFQATQAAQGVQESAMPQDGGGAPPGVEQPPPVQSGVKERQAAA